MPRRFAASAGALAVMQRPSTAAIIAAFAAVYIVWGSTYLAILFAIQSIPPLLMAGTRFLAAGAIMYVGARWSGASPGGAASWRTAAIVGACLLLVGNGCVSMAERYVPSGLAAVLVSTVPIFIAVLAWLTGNASRPGLAVWLGLLGGFSGVTLLLSHSFELSGTMIEPGVLRGMVMLIVAAFVWSAGSIYSLKAKNATSPFLASGQQMLCGGAMLVAVSVFSGDAKGFHPAQMTAASVGAWVYLVLVGSLVGFTAYIWLLRHCTASKVATYAYVNPVIAILLGMLFAGEQLTGRTALATALILGSVALVLAAGQRKIPAATAAAAPELPAQERA